MMSHACTSSTWEAEVGLSQVQSQSSLHSEHRPGQNPYIIKLKQTRGHTSKQTKTNKNVKRMLILK